ncbi:MULTISPECIES: TolC family protein [Variovorax]|uniref:TolC family protein n=1 Tax=unclassified Variovorax TaxID=663243 RepID=UPI00086CD2E5|nr:MULTISPECIES: TolC family protein [Variovorax]ODU13184.1 MAG: transporter [Variovorax sp. SCN 67-85]ODV21896.1 MAG: transporter [Variovorax sp. SCN 67-20]OJZ07384.1 MAG: transporter [Variovorax sp. 67-131]UKI11828.1 TolC family protein [Variovorax paradoxus]
MRTTAALAAALVLAGCASLSSDGGSADVQALTSGNPLMAGATAQRAPDDASRKRIGELLAQPLDAEAAVRIALVNSPRVQDAFATLQLSDADRVQAASLPNPVFAISRLTEGSEREIERMLSFNVVGLLTLPWQARWAGQRHESAKLQAAQSVLVLAADTRRAWVRAVAAQQSVAYLRDAKEAAEAGAELAHRMAKAGNWSTLQRTREQLLLADASAQLARAEQAAVASREQLTRLLGLSGGDTAYTLPDRLPPLPKAAPELGDVQALALRDRLDVRSATAQNTAVASSLGLTHATSVINAMELGVVRNTKFDNGADRSRSTKRGFELDLPIPIFDWGQARNGRAEALYLQSAARVRDVGVLAASEAREAWQGWNTAYAIARRYRDEVLPLRKQVNEEMVLRYNGMLASVWELLGETRASVLAVNAGIEAQRDFWLADTDLQLVLTGSSPGGMTALQTAAAGETPAAGGH